MTAPAVAQLSPTEQRMQQTVDAEQDRTVAMLERWVNQNSGTMNFAGVEAVGRMLRTELEPIGFKVDWIDMKAAGRSGYIVARHKGSGRGKRMLQKPLSLPVEAPHAVHERQRLRHRAPQRATLR